MRRFILTLSGIMFFLLTVTSIVEAESWSMWNPAVSLSSDRMEYYVGDRITFTVNIENIHPSSIAKDVILEIGGYSFIEPIGSLQYSLGDLNPGQRKEIKIMAKAITPSEQAEIIIVVSSINPEDGVRYPNTEFMHFKIKPKPDASIPEFPGGLGVIVPIIGILSIKMIVSKRKN